jgi:hypothetical protein
VVCGSGLVGDIDTSINVLDASADTRLSAQCGDAGPPNNVYGWGIVNALAAIQLASSPTPASTAMATHR